MGMFNEGKINGKFISVDQTADRVVITGTMEMGKAHGKMTHKWPNGKTEEQEFVKGKKV